MHDCANETNIERRYTLLPPLHSLPRSEWEEKDEEILIHHQIKFVIWNLIWWCIDFHVFFFVVVWFESNGTTRQNSTLNSTLSVSHTMSRVLSSGAISIGIEIYIARHSLSRSLWKHTSYRCRLWILMAPTGRVFHRRESVCQASSRFQSWTDTIKIVSHSIFNRVNGFYKRFPSSLVHLFPLCGALVSIESQFLSL